MKTILSCTAALALLALAGPASASSETSCATADKAQWLSVDAVKAKYVDMGYQVRSIKVEDGCFELYAIGKDGQRIEAYVDPVTAEIVKTKAND